MKTKAKTEVRTIRIRDVVVPKDRKREAHELDGLVASIREVGLINPITVTKDLVLIAGLHRLTACEILGWKEIPAILLSISQLDAELVEIDENLRRTELTVLERGEQTARRKKLYEARHPETRRGVAGVLASNRKQKRGKDTTGTVPVVSFVDDTAKRTKTHARTIAKDVQIGEGLTSEVRDAIRDTPLAGRTRELVQLTRIKDPAEQAQVAELVVNGKAKNVAEAQEQLEAAAEGPPVVRDQLGQVVTDPAIAEAFTILRPSILEVVRHVRAGARSWGSFNDDQEKAGRIRIVGARGYSHVRLNIERDLKQLAYNIAASAPFAICPYCQGAPLAKDRTKWCEGCRGGGWVTKSSYDSAPPETKLVPVPNAPVPSSVEGAEEEVSHEA